MVKRSLVLLTTLAFAAPLAAKDSLGVFGEWGAFRDPETPRCYAIAKPDRPSRRSEYQPFATVGTWPSQQVRGQVHIRLSRKVSQSGSIRLAVGGKRFTLEGGGGDAWAANRTMDAAITAAMRSANRMSVSARDTSGRLFTDAYDLSGVATAMDAATVGCARVG